MRFERSLLPGTLVRRYKRFLADVELGNGEVITAHTANTGAMRGCSEPGSRVYLSVSDNPRRKYRHTLEVVQSGKVKVGVNTMLSNRLAEEAIREGVMAELRGYSHLRREVPYGESSRVDLLLESADAPACFVEVKNVTLVEATVALFPDATTSRGARHMRELARMVRKNARAAVCFIVQRVDAKSFSPAAEIDPEYAGALREAHALGVEVLAYRARVGVREIKVEAALPVKL